MGSLVNERLVASIMESAFLEKVGENLRAARLRAGYTLEVVERATKGKFKGSAVGSYERAEREIPISKLMSLCHFYKVEMGVVLGLGLLTSPHEANTPEAGNLSR